MRPLTYTRVASVPDAFAALAAAPRSRFLAGRTNLIDFLRTGAEAPDHLVDINGLPLADISVGPDGARIGALARMSEVAAHPGRPRRLPGPGRGPGARRVGAVTQHGFDRWQSDAAHPMSLLPRAGVCLQPSGSWLRLRRAGAHRREPLSRHTRHQRPLHRDASERHGRCAPRPGRQGGTHQPRWGAESCARPVPPPSG